MIKAMLLAIMISVVPLHMQTAPDVYIVSEEIRCSEPAVLVYDAFAESHLTESQIAEILADTPLEEYACEFLRLEEEYGVNALFGIAVAHLESGLGTSDLAVYRNNLFGLRNGSGWARFQSIGSCVDYFGELMNTELYYGKSIDGIGRIYCGSSWSGKVMWLMEHDFEVIGNDS